MKWENNDGRERERNNNYSGDGLQWEEMERKYVFLLSSLTIKRET